MRVTVQADFRAVRKALRGLEKQAPYAISLALNNTAKEAREYARAHLKDTMTVRRKWTGQGLGGKGGRRLTEAERSTKKRLEVAVGSTDLYMRSQARTGTRVKGEGLSRASGGASGAAMAVPMFRVRKGRFAIVPRSKWPNRLLKKKNHVIVKENGSTFLARRKGRGKKATLERLWTFVHRVRIRASKRWRLKEQVVEVAQKNWTRIAQEAVQQAIATARAK